MTTAETSQIKPGAIAPNASISRKLKEFYDAVQEEGIPDRFLDLLERLEAAENAQKANAKAVDAK
ncbi:NepR family anti-sigma factor [Rhizobium sp.]|uniref:NepR family anti-sigma factor n=1 Tax=Rhizobium sp. TaxID=391 RepID=UPI0028B1365A